MNVPRCVDCGRRGALHFYRRLGGYQRRCKRCDNELRVFNMQRSRFARARLIVARGLAGLHPAWVWHSRRVLVCSPAFARRLRASLDKREDDHG